MVMRLAAVLVGSSWALAHGQPAAPDFDACKQRRRELTARAMSISSPAERGQLLAAMPVCRRFEDGSVEVVEHSPELPDASEFSTLVLAVRVGIVGISTSSTTELAPTGAGPFVELEGGYRMRREWSLSAFAHYQLIIDHIPVTNDGIVNDAINTTIHDHFTGGGIRVNRHARAFWFGGGLGADYEHLVDPKFGMMGTVTNHVLRSIELHLGYTFTPAYGNPQVMVVVGESGTFDGSREIIAATFTIGGAL
jgi:hypothetical protein